MPSSALSPLLDQAKDLVGGEHLETNVGEVERYGSIVGGAALTVYALRRLSHADGWAALALGGGLLWRGLSGHCGLYNAIGVNTSQEHAEGVQVEKSVMINRPAADLFAYWRRFENLPRFMQHLESVTESSLTRSHWVAKAPLGTTVEWDAEIVSERENSHLAWRSVEGADVPNSGSVEFIEEPAGRGTRVKVRLEYHPPGGALGAFVAKFFGEEPQMQVGGDLWRFKELMEAGELPRLKPDQEQADGKTEIMQ